MAAPATKLRLMCSNGGHILPRPHDKTLCYVGGETHIITMDRHTTLSNLTARITKTLTRSSSNTTSFSIKYQLPTEDLDSLITISTDEDLENMIDEYERLEKKRIRLFVFPTNPGSVSSIGSDLESFKSGEWFLNALNGSNSAFSDTSSVNRLLDLDDEKKDATNYRTAIDVNSIPGSPMVETTSSSFGSGTSIGQLKGGGGTGIEEQFAQLVTSAAPAAVSSSPVSSAAAGLENSDPFFLYHDRSEQQKQFSGFDFPLPDSVLSDVTISDHLSPVTPLLQLQSSNNTNQSAADSTDSCNQTATIQLQRQQQIQNPAYLLPTPTTQIDTQRPHSHHQQIQYIQPLQYIPHPPSAAVPVSSYYQQYPPPNQQNFVYYMAARQPPPGYSYPLQQLPPVSAATASGQAAAKSEFAAGAYAGGPQLVRVLSGRKNQNQYVGQTQYGQDR